MTDVATHQPLLSAANSRLWRKSVLYVTAQGGSVGPTQPSRTGAAASLGTAVLRGRTPADVVETSGQGKPLEDSAGTDAGESGPVETAGWDSSVQ